MTRLMKTATLADITAAGAIALLMTAPDAMAAPPASFALVALALALAGAAGGTLRRRANNA